MKKYLLVAVVALVLLGGYLFFSQYIGLVSMNAVVKQDWADLEAQLRARADLVPDLVSAVKDHAPEEEDVFTGVADALGKLAVATTPPARAEAEEALTAALGRLLVVANGCSELNADGDFIRLRNELADAERNIAVVMSLHETELAAKISDKIMLLKNGVCTGIGKPDEMLGKKTVMEHFDISEELYDRYHG